MLLLLPAIFYGLISGECYRAEAQTRRDSSRFLSILLDREHSPAKAALIAGVVPSGGQIYNRKYWKVPIAITGYGGAAYYLAYNQRSYKGARRDYLAENDTIPETQNLSGRSSQELLSDINRFRRDRDLSILLLFAWHGLCVIDANVDAHLLQWDVSEDLSLKVRPMMRLNDHNRLHAGLSLSMTLK